MPALLADVDGDADALVTVVLDSLDFAAAHRDRLAETFAHLGLRRTRTLRLGAIQDVFCDLAKLLVGVGKMGIRHRCPVYGIAIWTKKKKGAIS